MNPEVWGPHGWYFIQACLVHMSDDDDPTNYVNFLYSLQHVLPCQACRENYADWIRANPIPTTKNEMIQWITDLQNSIREEKGKPTRTVKQVRDYYTKGSSALFVILVVCVLLFFVLTKK